MGTISKATVLCIKEYGHDIREYTLKLEKNNYFEAGSFLQLTLDQKEDYTRWPESRNFSIASAFNKEGTIKLIIRRVGIYTSRIFNELTIGKTCVIKYAFGDFLLPFFDKLAPICCIAGGTGIAPIVSFCEQLVYENNVNNLHVFYSFKNQTEAPGLDILKTFIPPKQLHLFCTRQSLTNSSNKRIEWSDIALQNFNMQATHFYICGNEQFTNHFAESLKQAGATNVYTDEW